jgi:hypothetical protein
VFGQSWEPVTGLIMIQSSLNSEGGDYSFIQFLISGTLWVNEVTIMEAGSD